MITKTYCKWCSKSIIKRKSHAIYCSKECKWAFNNNKDKPKQKDKSKQSEICIQCGNTFISKVPWQKTCCYECGYAHQNSKKPKKQNLGNCKRCNKSLIGKKSHAMYCCMTCKSMDHTYKHRAKTRMVGVTRRMEVIERDNSTCYICNTVVNFNDVELDHLIPVSKGGNSSNENVAVSCMKCNRSRGNRINEKQLIKIQQLKVSV